VVGGADYEGILGEALGVEGVEDGADAAVERAGALLEGRHVQARLRGVGEVGGRDHVVGLLRGGGAEPLAVGLEEADGEEEGFVARALQEVEGDGHDVVGVVGRDLVDLVVADDVGLLGDVLLADERGPVAELVQGVDDVVTVVFQLEAAVGEADHPVGVGVLARQQAGAAPRARRGCAEGLAEDHTLLREALDVGRPDGVAVGPDPAPGVVGVDVKDVREIRQASYPFPPVRAAARSS
jgi:hypothetical protein